MNNKGQVFILTIILLPLLLLLIGGLFDLCNIYYQKHHLISVTKTIIAKNIEEKNENDIIKMYGNNDIEYEHIKINIDGGLEINIQTNIKTVLGSKILKKGYQLNIAIKGEINNNQIEYKRVSNEKY